MSEGLRVGLVGCGFHGTNLAHALNREGSTVLVACVDPDDEALDRMRTVAPDAYLYASQDDLLAGTDVDAIVVATPHDLLTPLSVAAMRRGKHVLAEKPIGMTEKDGRLIEDTAAQAGTVFMSGYSFRFLLFRHVEQLLRQGAVGDLRAITGSISLGALDEGWVADPARGGGPLLFVGSHLVDAMLWLVGEEPDRVSADMSTSPDTGNDITTAFQLGFTGGCICQGVVTQAAAGFSLELVLHGSQGWLAVRGFNFLQFEVEVYSDALPAYAEPTTIRPWTPPDHIAAMLIPELREFAAAVDERRSPSITASDGTAVLRTIDAIRRSATLGAPVEVTRTA